MKNMIVAAMFAAVVLMGSAFTGNAQQVVQSVSVQTPAQIKQRIDNTEGLVDPTQSSRGNNFRNPGFTGKRERIPAGERAVFVLMPSHEFIGANETLRLDLFPLDNRPTNLHINVQVLRPGDDGEYDGTQPPVYLAADNGNYGQVSSLQLGNKVHLLSRTFNPEDKWGRYTFNIVIYDSYGRLVQQIIYDVYYRNAGRWGRFFYIKNFQQQEGVGFASGNIPAGIIYYAVYDTYTGSAAMSGPNPRDAPISNGSSVMIASTSGYQRTAEFRVTLWSPVTRYAMFMPRAAIEDVPPQF